MTKEELIIEVYTWLVTNGYNVNRNNVINKGGKQIIPDALSALLYDKTKNMDFITGLKDNDSNEIYTAVTDKFKSALQTTKGSKKEIVNILNYLPDRSTTLNSRFFNFFKSNLVYSRDQNGTIVVLSRNGTEGNQWKIVNDLYSGIMMLPTQLHKEFCQLHTSIMQSPMRGSTYDVYNGDGSHFGICDWNRCIDISVAKATKAVKGSETLELPNEASLEHIRTARTLDPDEDPTLLPKIATTCQPGLSGFVYNQWEASRDLAVDMPTTITNEPTLPAFCYVNLDKFTDGVTPEFDGFMTSIDPAVRGTFMACIYATVFDKCHHSLVVWMHGEGSNGKSQFFAAINEYFSGTLVGSMSTKSLNGDFGLEGLIGKRIIIWGDCQNGNALQTNEVHGITGGDVISVNRKNKPIIDYKFNSLLFIGANKAPEIKMNAINETRRVLYVPMHDPDIKVMQKYCEFDSKTGEIKRHSTGQPVFKSYDLKAKLIDEMPHIMYKCKAEFDKYCVAPYNQMTVPPEAFELMVNKCEGGQNLVFNDYIVSQYTVTNNPDDVIPAKDFNSDYLTHVYGENSRNLLQKYNYELSDLKRYILTTYPKTDFIRKSVGSNGKISCYIGIRKGVNNTVQISGFGSTEVSTDDWA